MRKIKNFSIFALSNFIYSFSQWVILILVLKFIGIESMGLYSLGLAISAPVVLITSYGSNVLLITDNKYSFSNYFYSKISTQSIIYILILVFLCVAYLNDLYSFLIVSMVIFLKFTNSLIDLYFIKLISEKKHTAISMYKFSISFFYLIFNVFCIIILNSLVISILLTILINFIIIIFFVLKHVTNMRLSAKELKNLIILGAPISFTLFLSSLNTNIPKYGLEIFTNSFYVGVFTSLLFFYSVGNQVFFSINSFILPFVRDSLDNSNKIKILFKKIMFVPILFLLPFLLIFLFWGDEIIILIFNEDLLEYKTEMIAIILSSVLIYYSILFDIFINIYKKYKFNSISQLISAITVLLCSLFLISSWGISGAVVSFIVYCILLFVLKFIRSYLLIYRRI